MQLYCERYPDYQLLDVVNEPLHETPSYINSIGGLGATGWDWVIWAFQKARQHCPNAKLLINDYGILSETTSLESYILIINLLKTRNLIDGIGLSANYQSTPVNELSANLNTLAATGLPIYISQFDLDISDNTEHLNRVK
jgi:endo-1,4-beta-xylanase